MAASSGRGEGRAAPVAPQPPASLSRRFTMSSGLPLKDSVHGVGLLERFATHGLNGLLGELSWPMLFALILSFYLFTGLVVGALLRASAHDETDVPDDAHPFWVWSCRGLLLLHLQVSWTPVSAAEHIIAMSVTTVGSILTLCLFGVLYDKFSRRRNLVRATLRREARLHHGANDRRRRRAVQIMNS